MPTKEIVISEPSSGASLNVPLSDSTLDLLIEGVNGKLIEQEKLHSTSPDNSIESELRELGGKLITIRNLGRSTPKSKG